MINPIPAATALVSNESTQELAKSQAGNGLYPCPIGQLLLRA